MIEREITEKIKKLSETRKVVLVTGPRQVGKTTLLKSIKENNRNYVSLDDLNLRELAQTDPHLFMLNYKPPIIIDEIQYAPKLLSLIKLDVDSSSEKGNYWLTGSQKFHLMKGVSESLAGRVGILEMSSLSYAEKHGFKSNIFDPRNLKKKFDMDPNHLFEEIFKGGMPEYCADNIDRKDFFDDYIRTYIERDVRDLAQVGDIMAFRKFLISVASRTGEILNYNSISMDAGVDEKTAAKWISILVNHDIIYLLEPYLSSELKRATKTPKIYFMDTGLCSYLCKWDSYETLMNSSVSGHYLETFVISELIKNLKNSRDNLNYDLYYYRDKDGREIDLIVSFNNTLYPFEIKKTATPNKEMLKHFNILDQTKKEIGNGGVICLYPEIYPLDEKNKAIPISCIF